MAKEAEEEAAKVAEGAEGPFRLFCNAVLEVAVCHLAAYRFAPEDLEHRVRIGTCGHTDIFRSSRTFRTAPSCTGEGRMAWLPLLSDTLFGNATKFLFNALSIIQKCTSLR